MGVDSWRVCNIEAFYSSCWLNIYIVWKLNNKLPKFLLKEPPFPLIYLYHNTKCLCNMTQKVTPHLKFFSLSISYVFMNLFTQYNFFVLQWFFFLWKGFNLKFGKEKHKELLCECGRYLSIILLFVVDHVS